MPGDRILVVDDSADGRAGLRGLLELWGHCVEEAETADEAVVRARTFQPHAVVLDLGLGGQPDLDAIRRLRNTIGEAAMLVVYSGYADLKERAHEAGCDAFVVKPDVDLLEEMFGRVPRRPPLRIGRPPKAKSGAGSP